jgi:hypothetical protein
VREIEQECTQCRKSDRCEAYHQQVPFSGNYAFDLMVEVGLARFRDRRQDAEILKQLQERWGLDLPSSSVGLLADSFLDGLAAVHRTYAPKLRQRLQNDGGFVIHVDGTCEAGTDVLFTAIAEPRGWVLEVAKMATENTDDICTLMRQCQLQFGDPLGVVRDLSSNIAQATAEVFPTARDLICHYHFLENVGEKLCEKWHGKLTSCLRRVKIYPALRSIRHELVRWSRKGPNLSQKQIEQWLTNPAAVAGENTIALRRFIAYTALRWLDDYKSDLQGEYFPFDLPQLAFYRRAMKLEEMLRELVSREDFPHRELPTLKTISGHLTTLRNDAEVVATASRLEKAASQFEALREVLRLTSRPGQSLLRQHEPSGDGQNATVAEKLRASLEQFRTGLEQQKSCEDDEHKRADQAIVLEYLEKYKEKLVGHVFDLPGETQLIARRTNNPVEHHFGAEKQGLRRKLGVKKLTHHFQTLRAEVLLVRNLSNPDYLAIVLDGELSNLPAKIAECWSTAQALRKARQQTDRNHPMPTTKRQLREPNLLDTLHEMIDEAIKTAMPKSNAA